ncbi:MAG TPA: Dna2/Cas4 domain-containing protein, partial [Dysgonamonadaceae bacterium]|nr:Dna2/Cas4 domain-containing protein [Dysgonamonadaceae bacterium]
SDDCPPVIHSKICKNCSYYDFCYVEEKESITEQ